MGSHNGKRSSFWKSKKANFPRGNCFWQKSLKTTPNFFGKTCLIFENLHRRGWSHFPWSETKKKKASFHFSQTNSNFPPKMDSVFNVFRGWLCLALKMIRGGRGAEKCQSRGNFLWTACLCSSLFFRTFFRSESNCFHAKQVWRYATVAPLLFF